MSVKLPVLVSDGMVLQRDAEVKIWGTADEPVTVCFLGIEYHTIPDSAGNWEITMSKLLPGGPFEMRINNISIHQVFVGDVWLCSGQSNMQIPIRRTRHMYPEELQVHNPCIRQFTVPIHYDFKAPAEELNDGSWMGASPETIMDFSAAAYFFAKRLFEQYHVPIGLILAASGGTKIHSWMSREALADFPELLHEADICMEDKYISAVKSEDAKHQECFFNDIDSTDPGLKEEWYSTDYDDISWDDKELLSPWSGSGSIWLRKTLQIPSELAGKPATLFLGTLTDWDMVYVNGQAVGNTVYCYPPREYVIPSLPNGKCVITIRAISNNGGYFTPGKQYLLTTDEGSFNLNTSWKFRQGGYSDPPIPITFFEYKPVGLYNGMIAPLKRYAVKGAIWYQGESDCTNPEHYCDKMIHLVSCWRKNWSCEFPFIFVELPHWSIGTDWESLRKEQWKALTISNTAMAAAFDLGEHNDLHPQNKQPIGYRLARCAMRIAYGEKLEHSPFEIIGYIKQE